MSTGSSERADTTHPSEDIKNKAHEVGEQAKGAGRDQLERYRGTGADELARVAQSVKAAASDLESDRPGLSRYVGTMADSMERLANDMRSKSVDDLFRDVNRLARQNPGVFIAGSVALGFGLMRFAKASSHRSSADYERHPVRDRMQHLRDSHDEHEQGDMAGHTVGADGYIPDQDELNRHVYSGEPGGSVGSVSNAAGNRASSTSETSASRGTGQSSTGALGGSADLPSRSATGNTTVGNTGARGDSDNRNSASDSSVPTKTDPRIRSAGTTPSNVNRDSKDRGL